MNFVPQRIRDLGEEAERLQAQVYGGTPPVDPATPPPNDPGTPLPGDQPAANQAPPEPAPAPVTPSIPSSEDDLTWEQRFRTVQGKYDAEVPRLSADLRVLEAKLSAATTEIERLKALKPAEPQPPKKSLVTDKDVEAFGSDLIDVMDRKAREVAENMVDTKVSNLEAENRLLKEKLDGITANQVSDKRTAYFDKLGQEVPDFVALNVDQGFLKWLAEVDPLSGFPRQEYLNKAWAEFDARRTAVLFNAYKQTLAPAAPPTPPANQQVPSQPRQQLQRQVAPNKSTVSDTPASTASTKLWTVKEIETFYADVRRGAYQGKEAARAQVEAEIDQAVAQGRVR